MLFPVSFYKVTKQLNSLELSTHVLGSEDQAHLTSSCLSSLSASFQTLNHLRLSCIPPDFAHPPTQIYRPFVKLTILGADFFTLISLRRVQAPSNLKILQIPFYSSQLVGRDGLLTEDSDLLEPLKENPGLQNLKEIVVPDSPIDSLGEVSASTQDRRAWLERRKALENLEVVKKGNVKLRKVKPGEIGEYGAINLSDCPFRKAQKCLTSHSLDRFNLLCSFVLVEILLRVKCVFHIIAGYPIDFTSSCRIAGGLMLERS